MKLTAKQRKFINAYLQSGNGTEAAIQAGYAPKSARVTAARLLTNDNISKIINERQNKAANRADFSLEQWVTAVKKLATKAERDGDKLKALDLLGKHLGAYERDNKLNLNIKSMSESEVEALASKLMEKL